MEHKFKEGDKVKIVSDFPDSVDGDLGFAHEMSKYVGKVGVVKDVYDGQFNSTPCVCVSVIVADNHCWTWYEYCLEAVEDIKTEPVAPSVKFDITADISRQYTDDGYKVLKIFDSELDMDYPITAYIEQHEGKITSRSFTKEGKFYKGDRSRVSDDVLFDLVTRPEVKPKKTIYSIYDADDLHLVGWSVIKSSVDSWKEKGSKVVELTFDPNTDEYSVSMF